MERRRTLCLGLELVWLVLESRRIPGGLRRRFSLELMGFACVLMHGQAFGYIVENDRHEYFYLINSSWREQADELGDANRFCASTGIKTSMYISI